MKENIENKSMRMLSDEEAEQVSGGCGSNCSGCAHFEYAPNCMNDANGVSPFEMVGNCDALMKAGVEVPKTYTELS